MCVEERKLAQVLRRTHLPARYQGATFAEVETKGRDKSVQAALIVARQYAKDYAPGAGQGLLFTGSIGTGKTLLAAAILRELVLDKGAKGVFWDFRELLKAVQATFHPASQQTEAQVLAPILEADVLVLDELGALRATEWAADAVEYVLNTRYNAAKATICTTNYAMRGPAARMHLVESASATGYERRDLPPAAGTREETLGDRIGARMFSRLVEMCRIVPMTGEDYRQVSRVAL